MEQYSLPNLFSVKRQFESKYLMLHLPKSDEECTKCILPNFFLTCVVSIKDGKFLKCICGMFERWGFPCCHIYTVLQRSPLASNIIPWYHKHFMNFFGRDECSTNKYRESFLQSVLGPLLIPFALFPYTPPETRVFPKETPLWLLLPVPHQMIAFCKSGSHNASFRAISGKAVGDLCINFISSQYTLASSSKVAGTSQYHLLRPHFDRTQFCQSPFGTAYTIPPMERYELWILSSVCRRVKLLDLLMIYNTIGYEQFQRALDRSHKLQALEQKYCHLTCNFLAPTMVSHSYKKPWAIVIFTIMILAVAIPASIILSMNMTVRNHDPFISI